MTSREVLEKQPLNPGLQPAARICKFSVQPPTRRSTSAAWLSVYIASALSFIGTAQYAMYFTSLWPYLQLLDSDASETFFGYIIAIYSAGQTVFAPLFGYWSNRICQVRIPIIVGMLAMFAGNMIYLVVEWTGRPGLMLMASRLISGIGSGNVVLLRSYAATAVEEHDRARALTYVTCGQAVGLTIGPALQLLFTPLQYPGLQLAPNLHLNLFTAPAMLANAMNLLGTLAMIWCFEETFTGVCDDEDDNDDDEDDERKNATLPQYDFIAVMVCLVTRFTYMFINTNLETIGSPYSMMMFAWTEPRAVLFTSLAQGAIGLLTLFVYLALIYFELDRRMNYRLSSMIGLLAMALFHLITFSWPFLPGRVTMISEHSANISSEPPVGCHDAKFEWCANLTPVNVWFYYGAYVLALGLAFPVLNIGNTTLFSDVLGARRQGTQQGVLQMSGGTARLLGPIVISVLYSAYGPTMAWTMEIIVIALTLLLWLAFFRRMVPLQAQALSAEAPKSPALSVARHKMSVLDVAPDPSSVAVPHARKPSEASRSRDKLP